MKMKSDASAGASIDAMRAEGYSVYHLDPCKIWYKGIPDVLVVTPRHLVLMELKTLNDRNKSPGLTLSQQVFWEHWVGPTESLALAHGPEEALRKTR